MTTPLRCFALVIDGEISVDDIYASEQMAEHVSAQLRRERGFDVLVARVEIREVEG